MNVDPIPIDILIEILSWLPAKSLVKFVYVSKSWAAIIRDRNFINSFSSSRSSQPPRFLFAFNDEIFVKRSQENWHFFSKSASPFLTPLSSQLLDSRPYTRCHYTRGHDRFLLRLSTHMFPPHVKVENVPPAYLSSTVCHFKKQRYNIKPSYAHGLICFLYGKEHVVTNPTIGKSITLPTLKSDGAILRSFLSYDPVDDLHKVLCLTSVSRFCLTLGCQSNDKKYWRMIGCETPPHFSVGSSVCIDGVLYYDAFNSTVSYKPFLVGFDSRSETLKLASMFPQNVELVPTSFHDLVNYRGKVAFVDGFFTHSFTLWVLEDVEKQEWSKACISFSTVPTGIFHGCLTMLGVSDNGELIFAPTSFEKFYVYFVDVKIKGIRRVELKGTTKHKFSDFCEVFTFLPHVETLMFI